tara:strand:- start:188 stop:616 length:429 start_codon:yes stop_codon:yes gene_type:complete
MSLEIDTTEFVRVINFYKKQDNWVDILEEAGENVLDDIITDAKANVKGSLKDSISGYVNTSDNEVEIVVTANHPAASIIEFGGYSPFPPWEEVGGVLPFPVAKEIYETQPFSEPQPYLRPALQNNVGTLESEVASVARQSKQ